MIRLLVDSSADYQMADLETYGLEMIPLTVMVDDKEYKDEVELTRDELYEKLFAGCELKTSQPSPQEYVEVFEDVKEKGDEMICLTISSGLSGTYQSACLAKNIVGYEKIYIVDTLLATAAIRILVDQANKMKAMGCPAEEIVDALEHLKKRTKIYAALDTLKYLYLGGRVSKTTAVVADAANIKPGITFSEKGKVEIGSKYLGVGRAVKDFAKKISSVSLDPDQPVYLVYSHGDENESKLEKALEHAGIEVAGSYNIGATLGVHIGPGAFGMIFVEKA